MGKIGTDEDIQKIEDICLRGDLVKNVERREGSNRSDYYDMVFYEISIRDLARELEHNFAKGLRNPFNKNSGIQMTTFSDYYRGNKPTAEEEMCTSNRIEYEDLAESLINHTDVNGTKLLYFTKSYDKPGEDFYQGRSRDDKGKYIVTDEETLLTAKMLTPEMA